MHEIATGDANPAKRQKMEAAANSSAATDINGAAPIIRPSLLSEESRSALHERYQAGQPYPHCIIDQLCDPAALRRVRDEIIENVQATYKETDLFKMFQTGDLANMDRLDPESAAKLPTVLALRNALYSQEFRDFVSEVTGCGPLSDQTDCACNVHAQGGHLLCHDDVIGNRRVSYIIYLTDPEQPWTAEDGGALELYPQAAGTPHVPATTPTAFVLPVWNTMGMFTVQPGRSFHAIQEVYCDDKPRMSIQGWFHAAEAPEGAELATRNQLQLRAGEDTISQFDEFRGQGSTGDELSDTDTAFLLKWVNPTYLSDDNWPKVAARFEEDGSVQLQNFLKPSLAQKVMAACAAADAADSLGAGQRPRYEAGLGSSWAAVGPAHKQRYLRFSSSSNEDSGGAAAGDVDSPGALLVALQRELFSSCAFARLLRKLTTLTLLGQQGEVRRFRPGLDYTVAHFGILTKDPQLDAVLCFVSDSDPAAKEAWEGGEVGGFEAYLLADEDNEAAEVYKRDQEDEESGVLNVSPASNTLSLVLRDEGLMKFIKFLSFQAPSSRWDVAMTYRPEDDSDSEEEKEEVGKQEQQL